MSRESFILRNNSKQLMSGLTEFASSLEDGFGLFQEVVDPNSSYSETEKSERITDAVIRRVSLDASYYFKITNYLRQNKGNGSVVEQLDTEYFGIVSHTETTMLCERLYHELSGIKNKWYNIGRGLSLPSKTLDLFEDLSNPLLEVLVHWLKGRRDTPPSLDDIVASLKDPSVCESDLADKISRLYGDHREKEQELRMRELQADSDVTSELVRVPLSKLHLKETRCGFDKNELLAETQEMKSHFTKFLDQLQKHLLALQREGELNVSVIKTHLSMYDRQIKASIENCESFNEIFVTLSSSRHTSFLDYEYIRLLVDYGNDAIKHSFIDYKRRLQEYLEGRIMEQSAPDGSKSYFVIIDESTTKEMTNFDHLQNRIRAVLGHKNLSLKMLDIDMIVEASSDNYKQKKGHYEQCNISEACELQACEKDSVVETVSSRKSEKETSSVGGYPASDNVSFCEPEAHQKQNAQLTKSSSVQRKDEVDLAISDEHDSRSSQHDEPRNEQKNLDTDLQDEYLDMVESAKQLHFQSELHVKALEGDLPGIIDLMKKGYNLMDMDPEGNTALGNATIAGHLHVLKYFIDDLGFNPSISGNPQYTLLHSAIEGKHLHIVQYLLREKEVDPLCYGSNQQIQYTPLHLACISGRLDIVKELMEGISVYVDGFKSNLVSSNSDNFSPLHLAAAYGHLSVVKYITLDKKCDPSFKDGIGNIPLHDATRMGHLEVVKFLTSDQFSYDFMTADVVGCSALHTAAINGHLDIVRHFIEEKNVSAALTNMNGMTIFHFAASYGHLHMVKYLVELCDRCPGHFERHKMTMMHRAANHGHLPIVEFLTLEKKWDPVRKNIVGETPLHNAAHSGHMEVVKYLTSKGCSEDDIDLNGQNALHAAARNGKLDIVQYLIESERYNPQREDKYKMNPLSLAAVGGHLSVVTYLILDQECDPQLRDVYGRNAFLSAAKAGHLDIVQFLCCVMNCTADIVDNDGQNGLYLATLGSHLPVIKFLAIDQKYSLNIKSSSGFTAFQIAAVEGRIDIVRFFITELNSSPQDLMALQFAILGGSMELVKYLIETENVDVSSVNDKGQSALFVASVAGNLSLVKYFTLESKCDPFLKDKFGRSPFIEAAKKNYVFIIQFFVSVYSDTSHVVDSTGCNALHYAAQVGNIALVQFLIEDGRYDPSSLNSSHETSLHLAAAEGHLSVVQYLEKNSDLTSQDAEGNTPFLLAVQNGHLDLVKWMVTSNSSACGILNNSGSSAFHKAARAGHLSMLQYLIEDENHLLVIEEKEVSCKFLIEDKVGATPLHYAAQSGHLEVVEYLTNMSSIPPNLFYDNARQLPIHYAASGGSLDVLKYLERTNDIHSLDRYGQSCLHAAASHGKVNIMQYLIEEKSFDPAIQDNSGVTPLHLASYNGHLELILYLVLDKACNPLCRDKALDTPIHWAASEGQFQVIYYYGAEVGCSLWETGESGCTPLDYANFYGHKNIVDLILLHFSNN